MCRINEENGGRGGCIRDEGIAGVFSVKDQYLNSSYATSLHVLIAVQRHRVQGQQLHCRCQESNNSQAVQVQRW